MHQLPQELISHIATFVKRKDDQSQAPLGHHPQGPSKLAPYATISRIWQYAIERLTFQRIGLKSTELSYFSDIVVSHRRRYLAYLHYEIILPTYSEARCAKFENDHDKHMNNEVFTDACVGLLRILKSWESPSSNSSQRAYAITLNLYAAFSPMDDGHRGQEKDPKDKSQSAVNKREDLLDHRYEHSVLRLLKTQDLPTVSTISEFWGDLHEPRSIEPSSVAAIAASFVNLRAIFWTLKDNEKKDTRMRLDDRENFARDLSTITQPSLKTFDLIFHNNWPSNQDFFPALPLLSTAPYQDELSLALHNFSQRSSIETIYLGGPIVISPSLFWPDCPKATPVWPNLVSFHVVFNLNTMNGEWYFVRDPERREEEFAEDSAVDDEIRLDDIESDHNSVLSDDSLVPDSYNKKEEMRASGQFPMRRFRFLPDSEKITPLLVAMARAAGQMPKLQRITLRADLATGRRDIFEVEYLAAGQKPYHRHEKKVENRWEPRLYWESGKWRPDDEVLRLWRQAKAVDGKLLVRFVEW
ncbi:hypothetical protein P7C71_g5656, partial [Lecanoromycetidae sp. Uapishka_2]